MPKRDLIKHISISNYVLQKLTRIQEKISLNSLQNMHKALIKADYTTKTTNAQPGLVIELAVIELTLYATSTSKQLQSNNRQI